MTNLMLIFAVAALIASLSLLLAYASWDVAESRGRAERIARLGHPARRKR